MESSIRLRLSFKNGGEIFTKTQKKLGLKKSWILLQPQQQQELQTIADLSAYIIKTYHLQQSCPRGLLLSIDGFVLPPFETICLLKDQDIISVKKKGGVLRIEGNDGADNVEELHSVKKDPATCGTLLLANEEFEKEIGDYQSEESEEEEGEVRDGDATKHLEGGKAVSKKRKAVSKKRKAAEKSQSPKKKKRRAESPAIEKKEGCSELIESSHRGVPHKKKNVAEKVKKSKHEDANADATADETDSGSDDSGSDEDVESTPSPRRTKQLQKKGKDVDDGTPVSGSSKKGPSRSARRKYAKRRWLQEMAKIKLKSQDSPSKDIQNWKQTHAKAQKDNSSKEVLNGKREHAKAGKKEDAGQPKGLLHWKGDTSKSTGKNERDNQKGIVFTKPIQNGDKEDEVFPVVIRPGHIRFEPLDEDQAEQRSQLPVETFQWNGITSKKQGQKWGTNTSSFSRRNDKRESNAYSMDSGKNTHQRGQNWGTNTGSVSRRNEYNSHLKGDSMNIDKDALPRGQNWATNTSSVSQISPGGQNLVTNTSSVTQTNELTGDSMNVDKDTLPKKSIEFDKLPPLSVPKEGDVIAYRLLELSSSWTPEMTSFRVGKISWYNSKTGKIMLMAVQEFPIDFGEANEDDESSMVKDNSMYSEDGSLKIDFKALMDVRVLNNGSLEPSKTVTGSASQGLVSDENGGTPVLPSNNYQTNSTTPETGGDNHDKSAHTPGTGTETGGDNHDKSAHTPGTETGGDNHDKSAHTPGTENGVNLWEQFSAALSNKKEELSKDNGWGEPLSSKKVESPKVNGWGEALSSKKEELPKVNSWGKPSSARSYGPGPSARSSGPPPRASGSFRPWRGGAVGPTMARLRSEYKR